MRRLLVSLVMLALCGGLNGCVHDPNAPVAGPGTFKQAEFLYRAISQDESLLVLADIDLARWSRERPFIPVYLTVANRGRQVIELNLNEVILMSPSGKELRPVPYEAVYSSTYGRLSSDREYIERRRLDFTGNLLENMIRIPAFFYPELRYDAAASPRQSQELGARMYFKSLIYFPGLGEVGRYTLHIRPSPETGVSIEFPLYE